MRTTLILIVASLAISHVSTRGFKFRAKTPSISLPRPILPSQGHYPVRIPVFVGVGYHPNRNSFSGYKPGTPAPAYSELANKLITIIVELDQPTFLREISVIKNELKYYVNQSDGFRDINSTALISVIELLADDTVGRVLVPAVKFVDGMKEREISRQKADELVRSVFKIKNLNFELQNAITRFQCAFDRRNDQIRVAAYSVRMANQGAQAFTQKNLERAELISQRISKLVKPFRLLFETLAPCFKQSKYIETKNMITIENMYSFILFIIQSLSPASK